MSYEESAADDYAVALSNQTEKARSFWKVSDWQVGAISWRTFAARDRELPLQGWKIHITASALEACSLISAVLPGLFELGATFKIAGSLDSVETLNSGDAGAEQLGKVITIYPGDDDHARRILTTLDVL